MTDLSKISREDKLKILGLDEKLSRKQLSDDVLEILYEKKKKDESKPKSGIHIKKPKVVKIINKNDTKYKLVLEFLNAILVKLDKKPIEDITQFKKIKRDELLKPECNEILNQYLDRLAEVFGRTVICYRMKNNIETYLLTVLRNIVTNIGYIFESSSITKNETLSNRNYKQTYNLYYSIV